ncbi:arginine--tRNA ligase [Paenibacillus sp. GCM10012307]|uniref:Arginine--tRNA ligase n=1 Tax=Paenibacillus roseus TaxID=2798579 RepID=A0A934IYU0_9BACL|nr:arginine--tRNA ligase [Paenibacillus roseus]MBJ6361741.1 arginine--tRNA ligase [Paenibacillus roseus]
MKNYKKLIASQLSSLIQVSEENDVLSLLEYPLNQGMGDISLPCFKLSKKMGKPPQVIANELKEKLNGDDIERVEAVSGYLNIYLDKKRFAADIVNGILQEQDRFGSQNIGQGRTIVIDYSSPNIAKPFHVGHLRSTVIGNALYQIFSFLGYKCIGINHLGDWGTQFGKLIVAYQRWGNKEDVEKGAIDELLRLYVKFHDEAETNPDLEDQARALFVKIEKGDAEAFPLWEWFVDISLKEFQKIYDLLGVSFDSFAGESFYNNKMGSVVEELHKKKMLVEDEGAWLIRLDDYNMPPALMVKKDGSSLYHTRDVTAAIYRQSTFHFEKALYVTDYAQSLHFQQWFKIIELMGYEWSKDLVHVPFGRVSLDGMSLSTRKGNVVKLEDLLQQAIRKIHTIIEAKNSNLENKEEVARQIGVGAVIFNDLSGNRIKDIVFSWEEALNFEGETGPYIQYTHARACSVLRKANGGASIQLIEQDLQIDPALIQEKETIGVLKELYFFTERIEQAMVKLEPSIVSRYLIDLAQAFNRFYHDHSILVEDPALRLARLSIVKCVQITLRNGLRLIGLESPEKL